MSEQVETGQSTNDLIYQGTKAFWLGDYKEAVNILSKVSESLAKEHNDDRYDGLGNVYLYYGKSLLELAREAGDPLGDAVPKEVGVEPEDGSDEDDEAGEHEEDEEEAGENEEDEEEVGEDEIPTEAAKEGAQEGNSELAGSQKKKPELAGTQEGESALAGSQGNKPELVGRQESDSGLAGSQDDCEGPPSQESTAVISKNGERSPLTLNPPSQEQQEKVETAREAKPAEEQVEEACCDEDGEEVEEDTEGDPDEEEDPSDLQVAWEVLELAKEIFARRKEGGKEDYAECLITLGEVSMESENFDCAIADIQAGLALQKELYTEGKDMRKLAHSHYMLGMAYCAQNNVSESMECYRTTLTIIKERLALLEAIGAPGASDNQEISELKSLIPEVEEKITDLQTYADELAKNNKAEADDKDPKPSSAEKKATDISHLVKRKCDEEAGSASKRLAL